MDNSFRYLESVAGDETEANYPYTAEVNPLFVDTLIMNVFVEWCVPL